jgi:hypothetical protein
MILGLYTETSLLVVTSFSKRLSMPTPYLLFNPLVAEDCPLLLFGRVSVRFPCGSLEPVVDEVEVLVRYAS